MTDEQIKQMVDRFLGWRLPENFSPDAGISFNPLFNEHMSFGPCRHEPTGTNLFDAQQAEAMIRYLVEGIDPNEPKVGPDRVLLETDRYCPECGHNRDASCVSSVFDLETGTHRCQKCNATWREYELPEPEVEVQWFAVYDDAHTVRPIAFPMKGMEPHITHFMRSEKLNGQLIGKPVVLTREEALREVNDEANHEPTGV